MAKKKFVLRLEEDDYASIEKWAADEFRSVNGQIEWMLSAMLKMHKRVTGNSKPMEDLPQMED
ncbi:MAG: Arc family DNA binding domain-containing protein [Saprospiraceae bacterium]|nr:Arc family DNA binding domain-containing protein [Saprospiraceae bacterium]